MKKMHEPLHKVQADARAAFFAILASLCIFSGCTNGILNPLSPADDAMDANDAPLYSGETSKSLGVLPGAGSGLAGSGKKVLLIVESVLYSSIVNELDIYRGDLVADGWTVETILTPKRNNRNKYMHVDLATNIIWPRIVPGMHVFFVGSCPMPYIGFGINPDGHQDTKGAYASTAYYGIPVTNYWTDTRDNSGFLSKSAQRNIPGDGKFDQDILPSPPLVSIGFLDVSSLKIKGWGSLLDQNSFTIQKYREYFANNHSYRMNGWRPRIVAAQGEWTASYSSAFSNWAISNGFSYLAFRYSYSNASQRFSPLNSIPFGVLYDTKVFSDKDSFWTNIHGQWAVLDLYYGSYQIDFGSKRLMNPLGAGALATGSMGAINVWNIIGLEIGKTLGEIWKQSVSADLKRPYVVLYGDPTLTLRR
ncbi:MAG: hypothetical protein AABZ39_12255 [Spirochaetota bacterium]